MYSVLYVDDEPALLEIAKLILEQQGEFTLTTITSALEALEMMEETGYDAIVADYQMPGMDGIAFLKKTRTIFGDLPFILFTGKGREEVVIEAINNGADSYIQKGGDPRSQFAELAHRIRSAVERKRIGDALKQDEIRFEALVSFYQMTPRPVEEVMSFAVQKAVEITGSAIGYLACVNDEETMLTMHAWSAGTPEGCGLPARSLHYQVDSVGLWGEALRQRRPIITNDYTVENPIKRGYPPGHIPLTRHMNVPVFDGAHIVMIAGVGNKRTGYDDRDVRELSLLMQGLWNVIKERKAEEALRHSEARYRGLYESMQDAYCVVDLTGRILEVNSAYKEMLGFSEEELTRRTYQDLTPKRWHSLEQQIIDDQILTRGHSDTYEKEYRRKDGTVFPVEVRTFLIRDETGRPSGMWALFRDITERKRAEELLRSNEAQLQKAQEIGHTGSWEFDLASGMIRGSQEAFRIYGLPPSTGELPIDQIEACIPERERVHQALVDLLSKGAPYDLEFVINPADGTPQRVITSIAEIVRDREGRPARVIGMIRDITDQKGVENALRESEERYRNLADNLPDYLVVHRYGIILYANRTMTEITGVATQNLIGRHLQDFIAPESRTLVQDNFQKRIAGETLPTYEAVLLTGRGEKKTAIINATGISFMGEQALLAVITDITDRKRVEDALRESEERYRNLADSLPDYLVVHRDGIILYANRTMTEITGVATQDLVGRHLLDFIAPESRTLVQENIQRRMRGETIPTYETVLLARDGEKKPVIINATGISFMGEPAFLAVITDITDRKRAEVALRESEERYRGLADNLPDYLIVHRDGIIRYANRATAEMTGVAREDLIGRHLLDFIAPESRDLVQDTMRRRRRGETPPSYEAVLLAKEGKKKTVIINATGISFMGEPAFLTVITDITERKRAEEGLRQANRQLTLLSGITRHDILNNVTVILGYLGIASMKTTDPSLMEYFKRMELATRTIQSQIEFTRIYQDLGTHEPQWQSLKAVLHRLHPPPGITLITAGLQDHLIYADPMFERVFFNLLDNSVRHGQRVTEVRVTVHRVDDDLAVVWEDNGAGIPQGMKDRIFDRGFGENTGLGLFLVREILSISGIAISETGTPESGAQFTITVPKGMYRFLPGTPQPARPPQI